MEKKNVKVVGSVCSMIGVLISCFGKFKYDAANGMYKTASYFGKNDASDIWDSYASNYKIVIIVGLIVLLVGIVILVSGFMIKDKDMTIATADIKTSTKLLDLQNMLDSGLITQEEFEENKKRILQSM